MQTNPSPANPQQLMKNSTVTDEIQMIFVVKLWTKPTPSGEIEKKLEHLLDYIKAINRKEIIEVLSYQQMSKKHGSQDAKSQE